MDINEIRTGMIINNAGKIGVVDDIFRNDKGEAWIQFSSADTVVRSPFSNKTNEFIPFVEHAVTSASINDLKTDVESKIKLTKENMPQRISEGIKAFSVVGKIFVTDGIDAYLLDFAGEKQCLIETILGEMKLVHHPRMFKIIPKDKAIEIATERYFGLVDSTVDRLNEFLKQYSARELN